MLSYDLKPRDELFLSEKERQADKLCKLLPRSYTIEQMEKTIIKLPKNANANSATEKDKKQQQKP